MHVLTGFVKTHILDEHEIRVVGEISCGSSESDDNTSTTSTYKLCQLTKSPTVVVVTCDTDVKPEDTFLWTHQVRQLYHISLTW